MSENQKAPWLQQARETLCEGHINLNGSFKEWPQFKKQVAGFIKEVRELLTSLRQINPTAPVQHELEDAFLEGLEKSCERILKGVTRGKNDGWVDKNWRPELEEGLMVILGEYQDLISKVLEWSSGLKKSTFPKASTLIAFHGKQDLECLDDDSIQSVLAENGVTMSEEEVKETFTKSVRLLLAVNNISDPMEAVIRVAKNVQEKLTDGEIVRVLEENGVTMSEEEVRETFTKGVRLYLAVNNRSDPMEAVTRVAKHVTETLTTAEIVRMLAENGVMMDEEDVMETFTKSVRLYLAVHNISNPLGACVQYAKGEIGYGGQFLERDDTTV